MHRSSLTAILFISLLVGCGGPADRESDEPTTPDAEGTSAGMSSEETPLGEAALDMPGHRVQLLAITRVSRGVLEVRFALAHEASDGEPTDLDSLLATAPGDAGTVADAFIVEPNLKKKYYVLRDAEDRPISSRTIEPLASGERIELWARFPVPSGEARQIDVHIPHAPLFGALMLPPAPPARP